MKEDTYGTFSTLFDDLGIDLVTSALRRSIAISSMDSVREMAERTGQHTGMASVDKFVEGFSFLRSGDTKQYAEELDQSTVASMQRRLSENAIPIEL
jgi:hypothetical protein